MKKLAVFFIVLISLVVIAGCNHSKKTVTRFSTEDSNGTKTTITKLEDEEKPTPAPIEIPAADEETDEKTEEEVAFAVTSVDGDVLRSDKGYHLIQGTTPTNTQKILVNGYALNKYEPGDTEWSYIAAASLGTLKKGDNTYTVRAVDKKGKQIAYKTFTIVYGGEDGVLASTGNSLTFAWILALLVSAGIFIIRPAQKPRFR